MASESFLIRLDDKSPIPQHVLAPPDHEALRISATLVAGDWPTSVGFTVQGSNDNLTWETVKVVRREVASLEVSSSYLYLRVIGYGTDQLVHSVARVTVEYLAAPSTASVVISEAAASRDAFGRWRVSNPKALFDSKHLYGKAPLFWDESIAGTATSAHSAANSDVVMTVVAKNDEVIRQSRMRFNYQPGRSQFVMLTALLGEATAGVTKCFGLHDDDDGLFFKQDGDGLSFVVRKGGSDTEYAQADWNMDPLDGTGPSGHVFDPTSTAIYWVDFEWLGVGTVRYGIVRGGQYVVCGQLDHDQVGLSEVYMTTPNLPVRYSITAGEAATSTLHHICCAVLTEGGDQDNFITRSASTNGTHVDANVADTTYAVVGIRLKSTHLSAQVRLLSIAMLSETNDKFEWIVYLNPTVAGAFTYSDVSESACQAASGATANTVTNGYKIYGGWGNTNIPTEIAVPSRLALGSTISGTSDTLVLCVRPLSTMADIQGTINWTEVS